MIAGMTLSRVSPAGPGQTMDRSEGILAGVYGRIHPNVRSLRSFMLEADVQFVQKRSTLTDTVNGVTRNADLHLNYIEVPIAF